MRWKTLNLQHKDKNFVLTTFANRKASVFSVAGNFQLGKVTRKTRCIVRRGPIAPSGIDRGHQCREGDWHYRGACLHLLVRFVPITDALERKSRQ